MSKTIDERVVEMRFDNKNFETNVSTTMNTLDKLKKSLNLSGASKGLENIDAAAKGVNMSPLAEGVETVKLRFSALEVMAVTALSNITNSALNAGKRLVSSLTIDQVTAGWNKYEQKTASVQTIMNATGKSIDEVNGYLDKLMWYSDETSYGFTDMTSSLAQLTSAGGNIENLIPMIEGVANATAFAGKGAAEFSRAIFNLNQSYSAGYLQMMDWRSLELAGVASKQLKQTLIDTAVELGKIKEGQVDIATFSSTLKDKWADTEVMEKAFGKFAQLTEEAYKLVQAGEYDTAAEAIEALSGKYDEIAEKSFKAAQEAKTFSEAIEATKDAVSSGWMKTSELIFGNKVEATKIWTELCNSLWEIFASGGDKRNEILSEALNSKWSTFTKTINEAGLATEDFQSKLAETASEHGIALDDLISEYGSLEAAIGSGKISTNMIVETLKKFAGVEGEASKATEDVTGKLEKFQKVVDQVWKGDFGNGADRIKQLTDAGYDYATVQDLVNKTVDGHRLTLDDLSDSQLENLGYTEDQVKALRELAEQAEKTGTPINELIESLQKPSGRELLIDSFRNILSSIKTVIMTVKDAWSEIFDVTPEGLYSAIEAFHELSEEFKMGEETADKLKRSLKGVFAILDIIGSIVGSVLKTAFRVLGALFKATTGKVLDFTASVGDSIVAFRDWFKEHNFISAALEKLGDILVSGIEKVSGWIDAFKDLPIVQKAITGVQKGFEKLKKVLSDISTSKIVTFIKKCVTAISNWIKAFKDLPVVQKAIKGLQTAFSDFYNKAKEYFGKGFEKISEFIERCKDLDGLSLENIKTAFKDFYDNVFKYFFDTNNIKENIKTAIDAIFNAFWSIDDRLSGVKKNVTTFKTTWFKNLTDIGGKLGWFKDKLVDMVDLAKEKLPALFAMASAAVLIKSLDKIGKALDALATPLNIVKSLIGGVTGALQTFAKGLAFQAKAKGVKEIAIAIGILAASLWVLAQVPAKDLGKAVLAIGALAIMLGVLAKIVGKMSNMKDVGNLAKASLSFIALAGALIILAGALKIMESLDFNAAWKNAILLGGLAIALGVAVGLLNKLSKGQSATSILGLVGIALALKILVGVLVDLDSTNFNHIGQTLLELAGVVAILGAIALACKFVKFGTAVGILGIVLAIKLFIGLFDDIANINIEQIKANLENFKMVFGLLIGLLLSMALSGKNAAKAGIGILAMCAGILLLTKAIKDIAGISASDIDKGTSAISKLLFMFAILTAFSKLAGDNAAKAGRMLVTASVGILILVGAIYLLKDIDPDAIKRGTACISVLLGMMSLLVASTKNIPKNGVGVIVSLTVAIAALTACVALLSALDKSAVTRATACLSVILGMFSLLIASTKLINTEGKAWLKTAAILIVLTGVVAGLALILKMVAGLPAESTIATAAALSIVLLAMSAAMVILSKVGTISLRTLGAMAAVTLVVGALAGILYLVQGMPVESTLSTAVALSVLLIAMAAAIKILGTVGKISSSAYGALAVVTLVVAGLAGILWLIQDLPIESTLANAASLSVLILALSGACALLSLVPATGASAGIVALLEVFGATGLIVLIASLLDLIPGVQEFMAGGFDLLKQFASGLGEVIGSFITGIGEGLTEGLADIADNLTDFGEHLQPFIESIKDIDSDSADGLKNLCLALLDIQIAQLISLFTGKDLSDFGEQLKSFGEAICAYSSAVSAEGAINTDAIDTSITAASKLVDLANSVPDSSLIAKIVDLHDIGTFADNLTQFGTALTGYSSAVSAEGAIDQDAIENSITAADKLVELANSVPDSSLVAKITNNKNIGDFGKKLADFGDGICACSAAVSAEGAINQEAIGNAIDAADKLVELANSVPDSSLVAKITNNKNIGNFGKKLADFGEGLADYGDSVKDIDTTAMGPSITAAMNLSRMAQTVSNGEIDFDIVSNFKDSIEDIGEAVGSFGENVSGDSGVEAITTATASCNQLVDLINTISTVDTSNVENFKMALDNLSSIDLINFSNSFGTAGQTATTNMSTGLTNGIPSVRGAVSNIIFGASQEASGHIGQFVTAGNQSVSGIGTGINSGSGTVTSATGNAIAGALQIISGNSGGFLAGGINAMSNLGSGITGGVGSVQGATNGVIGNAINTITSRNGQFSTTGNTSMSNLGNGITKGLSSVSSASSKVVDGAISAADGKSSSFTSIGSNMMEGLKGGILSKASSICESVASAVSGAIDKAKSILGIKSPSRVFAGIGRYVDEGFINGLNELSSKVASTSENVAYGAIDGAKNIISNIGSLSTSDMDFKPTIRPVVDMKDAKVARLDLSANVDTFLNKPIASLSKVVTDAQTEINASNREVVNAINSLREDLAEFYSSDGQEIGLYVDSKKLASSIAKPMNRELNILSKRGAY